MNKRGQVTIFVIIAVLIVGVILVVVVANDNSRDFFASVFSGEIFYPNDVQEIDNIIEECIDESLERVIVFNGLQGGYYFSPENSIYYDNENTIFARNVPMYYDTRPIVPSSVVLENEIENGMEFELARCVNDRQFIDGPIEIGKAIVDIDFSGYNADAILEDEYVRIKVKFPVRVEFRDEVYLLEDFSSEYETNYLKNYLLAREITNIQGLYKDEICLTCINDATIEAEAELLNHEFYEDENTFTVVYNIIKKHPVLEEFEVYSFAHRIRS